MVTLEKVDKLQCAIRERLSWIKQKSKKPVIVPKKEIQESQLVGDATERNKQLDILAEFLLRRLCEPSIESNEELFNHVLASACKEDDVEIIDGEEPFNEALFEEALTKLRESVAEKSDDEMDRRVGFFERKLDKIRLHIQQDKEAFSLVGASSEDLEIVEKELKKIYDVLQDIYYDVDELYAQLKDDERAECVQLMQALMAKGAEPLLLNFRGKGVLHYFFKKKLYYLIDHFLEFISEKEREECLKACIDFWLNNEFDRGLPFLEWDKENLKEVVFCAINEGLAQFLNYLFMHGASPLGTYQEGITLLTEAVVSGHKRVVSLLLNNGCNPNVPNGSGMTPLLLAAQCNDITLALLLLEKKADPNLVDSEGLSPLHYAATSGKKDLISHLISHGADKTITTKAGDSAARYAQETGHAELVPLLK